MENSEEGVQFGTLNVVANDERREIREREFPDSSVQLFVVKDGTQPLGQHYHRKKVEIFYFTEGGGIIYTAQVNSVGEIVGEVKKFEVVPGVIIRIPPYHTHRFDLLPGTRFVAFSSKPFDQKDMPSCTIKYAESIRASLRGS